MNRVISDIFLWTIIIHLTDNNPYPFMLLTDLIIVGLILYYMIEKGTICENSYKILLVIILYIFTFCLILEYLVQSTIGITRTLNILGSNLINSKYPDSPVFSS